MNKKGEQNALLVLILLAMTLLIGFALLNPVANTTNRVSELQITQNESKNLNNCVSITPAKGWEINESNVNCNVTVSGWYSAGDWRRSDSQCYISSVTVKNGTSSALVKDTDYIIFDSSGLIKFKDTTATENLTGNNTYLVYSTCDEGYFQDAGTRGISKLWSTMMIIVLLVIVAGVAYSQFKEK